VRSVTVGMAAAATVAAAGIVAISTASGAAADVAVDAGNTHPLGSQATLTNGDVVQGWTISDLKPSSDAIPYPVQGNLWEVTATDVAIQGWATPIVSDLNARSAGGQTYRALYQVATPQGVNPATLAPGEKTTGKVYFDVTGDNPDSVVYNNAENQDLATWVQPPPAQGRAGGSATTAAAGAAAGTAPATPPGAPVAQGSSGSQGTPAAPATPPAGTPAAPAAPGPSGSQGTPATPAAPPAGTPEAPGAGQGPEGTPTTPAPAGGPEAPASTPATPAPAGGQEAPPSTPATPAPGGSQGTPAGGGSPAPAS
jgi:hypothetical protein